MADSSHERLRMVETQIAGRGIRDPRLLAALRAVPREIFLPRELAEFAYEDTPLPIEEGQTASQPYIVALLLASVNLAPTDRVLELGTGSGYGSAVLSRIVAEVYSVESNRTLATLARDRLWQLSYDNVKVLVGDPLLGWPEFAPYDAIVITAGSPPPPPELLEQLRDGGRLVMAANAASRQANLLQTIRGSQGAFETRSLGALRLVPQTASEATREPSASPLPSAAPSNGGVSVSHLLREVAEPVDSIDDVELDGLLDRIDQARVVLLGEATHGTAEFYRMRARITRELILRRGFTVVALEADWPDAARVNAYVRQVPSTPEEPRAFSRFPTWMWRNREFDELVTWLREHNQGVDNREDRVAVYGLDLYSLFTSINAVVRYLDEIDPEAGRIARHRYGCLTPWERDPARYGEAALSGRYRLCEAQVVAMLGDMLRKRVEYSERDGERFLDAVQNARLVANAERYYRVMYYGSVDSWNLRDSHMFDTLKSLLSARGHRAKAVVWEHNSHVGDAAATEMGARGEHNVGHLCRRAYGDAAYLVGFGTDHGTVAAASQWGGPAEIKAVRPAHATSYERLCHESGVPAFLLPLREPRRPEVREELTPPRLERAIGVIYRPETELQSHYFQASLPHQFDEYVWFDATQAVAPLELASAAPRPESHPFGS